MLYMRHESLTMILIHIILIVVAQIKLFQTQTVTTRYESPHSSGSTYYVLHRGSVTLVCDTGLQQSGVRSLIWSDAEKTSQGQLYNYYFYNEEHNLVNDFIGRDIQYEFSGTEHRLTINSADILTDGRLYICDVRDIQRNPKAGTLDLRGLILKSPESVTLNLPTAAVEDTEVQVQCSVTSVYPGKAKTDFILRVGSESYTDGEETENVESNSVTYTVTYTYNGEFDRTHQGQQVQCEVTWQDNTPVEIVKTSSSQQLNIYYAPDTVTINANSGSAGNVGDTKIMTCTAEANPDPEIALYRLEGSERKKVGDSATSSLSQTITLTKEINRQNFVCTATSSNTTLLTYSEESARKYYTILFPATAIGMSQSPSGAVTENTDVTFTCVTDEAEPTAEVVWTVEGNDVTSNIRNTEVSGDYNAKKRRSELTVRVDRTLNGQTVECHVKDKSEVKDTKILNVRYPPQLVHTNGMFYSKLGQPFILNITVRAYPEFADINSAFIWSKANGMPLLEGVTSYKVREEEFYSQLEINSVRAEDIGGYIVVADNGVKKPANFTLTLAVRGIPSPPYNIMFESVTAISVLLSWLPGHDGGAEQKFTVYYRKEGETKILFVEGIITDLVNARTVFLMKGLQPETRYFFRVQAQNIYGESDQQPELSTTTLRLPTVQGMLEAQILDGIVVFRWGDISGDYTSLGIYTCHNDNNDCVSVYNVTDPYTTVYALQGFYNDEIYVLQIHQDSEIVLIEEFRIVNIKHTTPSESSQSGYIVGIAVTSVVAVLAISAFVISVIHIKRKSDIAKRHTQSSVKENVEAAAAYENVNAKSSTYEMTQPHVETSNTEYTDLQHATYEQLS